MSKHSLFKPVLIKWCVLFVFLFLIFLFFRTNKEEVYQSDYGKIFGTEYHITYFSDISYKADIEKELLLLDASVSIFNKTSVISKVNKNESVVLDDYFLHVFKKAQQISFETEGAFDATVAPLVNAWGFGFKDQKRVDSLVIDSLKHFVGYRKVSLQGDKIVKKDPRLMLDFGAIAKGYAVDVVARLLERRGVFSYMVEIGGEIIVRGKSPKHNEEEDRLWHIGISRPIDDSLSIDNSLQIILKLTDKAVATSGNYRNYYYRDGKKFAHTISPITGYPVLHSLLSATVIANDCMTADAYATSFMVMGLERTKTFVGSNSNIDVYLVYVDAGGVLKTYYSSGMKKYFSLEEE